MTKSSGLGQQLYLAGYDLSGDVGAINNAASPRALLEMTGINKSAYERVNGLADGVIDFNSWFNDANFAEHAALKGFPTADVLVLWATGASVGDPAKFMTAKQVNYDGSRTPDGAFALNVLAMAQGVAPEWGEMLTSGQDTHASAGSAASKDDSASSANGAAAQLQVIDIDSGTPTVIIEDSPDDSGWTTLISFTAVADGSEPTAERKTVTGTVNRYLRHTTTGTFTNADIAIAYRRGTAEDDVTYT